MYLAYQFSSEIYHFRVLRMEARLKHKRPKHLDLFKITQPLPAIVSIMHRISGVLLFFRVFLYCCMDCIWCWNRPKALRLCRRLRGAPGLKLMLVMFIWFCLHHLCAGIRYLALDLHYGIELDQARATSKWVLAISMLLTLLMGVALW